MVGSSRNTSSGWLTNASASASRCRWPPDSESNGASAFSASANRSSSSAAAAAGVERREQRQRFARRDLVLQRDGLKRRADLLLDGFRVPPRVDAAHFDRAGFRLAQTDHAFERRCLARAVRTEQPENLAVLDLEADALRRQHVVIPLLRSWTITLLRFVTTTSALPPVDDRLAQIEPEGALGDDDDRRALEPLVDRAAEPAEAVVDDGAERSRPCACRRPCGRRVGHEARRVERAALEQPAPAPPGSA